MLVGVWEKGGGRGGGYALSNLIQQVKDIFITTEHKTNNVGLNVELKQKFHNCIFKEFRSFCSMLLNL